MDKVTLAGQLVNAHLRVRHTRTVYHNATEGVIQAKRALDDAEMNAWMNPLPGTTGGMLKDQKPEALRDAVLAMVVKPQKDVYLDAQAQEREAKLGFEQAQSQWRLVENAVLVWTSDLDSEIILKEDKNVRNQVDAATLAQWVSDEITKKVDARHSFTAYDITTAIRAEHKSDNVEHTAVRDQVHSIMANNVDYVGSNALIKGVPAFLYCPAIRPVDPTQPAAPQTAAPQSPGPSFQLN